MEKDTVFEGFLKMLNEAVAADRDAMQELVEFRTPCNDVLADHPTIQVSEEITGQCVVGLIGIINGCCENLTGKRVAGDFDASGNLIGFVPYTNMAEKIA